MKEKLMEIYRNFDCELGANHPETIRANKLYNTYCIAEHDTIEKAIRVYTKELREIIHLLNKIGELQGIEELGEVLSFEGCVKDFREAMEK